MENDLIYLKKLIIHNTLLKTIISIIIVVAIIFFAYYIYKLLHKGYYESSLPRMSTQEIEDFNSQLLVYGGIQTGKEIKILIDKLISNVSLNHEKTEMIPTVMIITGDSEMIYLNVRNKNPNKIQALEEEYSNQLFKIRNDLNIKKKYNVQFIYDNRGLIDQVVIVKDIDD